VERLSGSFKGGFLEGCASNFFAAADCLVSGGYASKIGCFE